MVRCLAPSPDSTRSHASCTPSPQLWPKMTLAMVMCPLGSESLLLENHWPRGCVGRGLADNSKSTFLCVALPAILGGDWLWPGEAAWGVSYCHLLISLLITLAVDEESGGNPVLCQGCWNFVPAELVLFFFSSLFFFVFCFFCLFRAAPTAYGGSQARGPIRAVAASLCQSHNNARSKSCLQPMPQLIKIPDP